MKYLKDKDLEIFDKEDRLRKKAEKLEKEWEELVRVSRNESEYEATRPKFDEYVKATNEWLDFLYKNGKSLLARKID